MRKKHTSFIYIKSKWKNVISLLFSVRETTLIAKLKSFQSIIKKKKRRKMSNGVKYFCTLILILFMITMINGEHLVVLKLFEIICNN